MFKSESRFLVVDDMMTMRKVVMKNLKDLGFTTMIEAADGNLAWEALASANPPIDIIISDWNMPNCSGLDFLKKVRADAKYAKLPFIMLTAEAEAAQIKEAVAAGVTNYILKPFTPEMLKVKLEQSYKKVAG